MLRRLAAYSVLVLFAATCAACGGGGGGGDTDPAPDDPPPPQPKPTWAVSSSSTGDCWAVDVAEAPDGTLAVAGGFYGTGTIAEGTPAAVAVSGIDESDSFVARVDPAGILLWAQVIAGQSFTDVRGLDVGPDGAIYVCGYFFDTVTFAAGTPQEVTFTTADGEDGFVAAYEASGVLRWARQVTGTGTDELHDVAAMPDGAVVVAGLFADPITLGEGELLETTLTPTGWLEAMVFAYAPDGKLRWAKQTHTSVFTGAWSIAALSDGGIAVTGDYVGSATFGQDETNETTVSSVDDTNDVFVAKLDINGNLSWVRSLGGNDNEYANRVVADGTGGLRATGIFAATATFEGGGVASIMRTTAGRHDGYLVNYDASGDLQWVNTIGGPETDECLDVRSLADGTTVVVGYFTGSATVGSGQPGETTLTADAALDEDAFMAGYGPTGLLEWSTSFGGPGNDQAIALMAVPDGTWIVTGSFKDQLDVSGAAVLTGVHTASCAFFARLDENGDI